MGNAVTQLARTLDARGMRSRQRPVSQRLQRHSGTSSRAVRSDGYFSRYSSRLSPAWIENFWRLADPVPPRSEESFIPWDTFAQSVTEGQPLSQAEDFDFLHRIVVALYLNRRLLHLIRGLISPVIL
jgi:hypothetical protein